MKKKCFGYLRVSSVGQSRKDGFPRQEKAVRDYALANGYEVVGIFKDAYTGTKEKRPALAEMLFSMERNGQGVETVLIEALHRLSRDVVIQEAIIKDFMKKGFQLVSAAEGPDLADNDPSRKLIRQIMGCISEYEKDMIVERLQVARDRESKRLGHRVEGRVSHFGDTEEEQRILRRMRAWRRAKANRKGETCQAIADKLNAEGVKTKDGNPWSAPRVWQVLNPKDRRTKA